MPSPPSNCGMGRCCSMRLGVSPAWVRPVPVEVVAQERPVAFSRCSSIWNFTLSRTVPGSAAIVFVRSVELVGVTGIRSPR